MNYEEESVNVRKAWVEAQVTEFGRVLPGVIALISKDQVKDIQLLLESAFNECWEIAQAPLISALMGKMNE